MDKKIRLGLLCTCLFYILLNVACESRENDGTPIITGIRSLDASKADSLFTEGIPWQIVVLVGENLDGVREIYINGQSASFNPTYATSTHIIFTIPGELTLVGEDPTLPNEIRVITKNGIATYPFHVNSPAPYAISYTTQWHGKDPIRPGQEVVITGENFYEIQRIVLSNIDPSKEENKTEEEIPLEEYEITDYVVGDDYKSITVKMPQVVLSKGYLVIECYSGIAVLAFRSTPIVSPIIEDISSDMPILGETVTIYGKNFKDIVNIEIGDREIIIPAKQVAVNETFEELSFILSTIPNIGNKLIVVTEEGRDTIPFYQTENIVADFDNYGAFWWGGNSDQGANAVNNETAIFKPICSSGIFWGIEGTTQIANYWWGALDFGNLNVVNNIPDETLIKNIELRFECYVLYPFGSGANVNIKYPNREECSTEFTRFVDKRSQKEELNRWMTCSIPLNTFSSVSTYGEFKQLLNGELLMHVNDASANSELNFYVDNFRLYVNYPN